MSSIVLEVDFFNKKNTTQDPFNSDEMAKEFSIQFCKQAFTVGMQCVFNFQDKKLLQVVVKVRLSLLKYHTLTFLSGGISVDIYSLLRLYIMYSLIILELDICNLSHWVSLIYYVCPHNVPSHSL